MARSAPSSKARIRVRVLPSILHLALPLLAVPHHVDHVAAFSYSWPSRKLTSTRRGSPSCAASTRASTPALHAKRWNFDAVSKSPNSNDGNANNNDKSDNRDNSDDSSDPPPPPAKAPTTDPSSLKFQYRNSKWILLVDDEDSIRTAVGDFLYDSGYQVTACADRHALLEVCRTHTNVPDAIISDIRMQEGPDDGIELVRLLKKEERLQRIPILFLTAKGMTQDRVAGYRAGADVYLTKPFDPNELLSIVDNVIRRREAMEQGTSAITMMSGDVDGGDSGTSNSLRTLKNDLEELKQLMKDNSQKVVKKTNVVLDTTERRVLNLLCDGYTSAEIAERMPKRGTGLNVKSMSVTRIQQIIQKMYDATGTGSRTELVRWAVMTGYVRH